MKKMILLSFLLSIVITAMMFGQPKRPDVTWARVAPAGSITLDGKMNESVWSKAESIYVQYGKISALPGGGYTAETGTVLDSAKATIKFLVMGDSLYLGITVKDSSIGGGIFGAADAFIFNIRDKSNADTRPSPPGEYLWGWIDESWMDPGNVTSAGALPKNGPNAKYTKQDYETATTVKGTSNTDATADTSYTVEMKINLKPKGYNVQSADGDIVMFSGCIRDCDWFWPIQDWVTFSRVWIQFPWANVSGLGHQRIYVKSTVTTESGTAPVIAPDFTVTDGTAFATPVIDGKLDESAWTTASSFDIRFGDAALRNSYPSTGPFRSGQYQPSLFGGTATVSDPGNAKVKMFVKQDTLYVGVDVSDKVVQSHKDYDRWDGVMLTINGMGKDHANDIDHNPLGRKLTVRLDPTGKAVVADYLGILVDSLKTSKVGLSLKGTTTVDTIGLDEDAGYQVEYSVDLTKLGYPAGLGDRTAYIGVSLLDGDSYVPSSFSYGTRTWWFREHDFGDGPAFVYLAGGQNSVLQWQQSTAPEGFILHGNYPNPFNPSTSIRFAVPEYGPVQLTVFNTLGQTVSSTELGYANAGVNVYNFNAGSLASGVYFYQLSFTGDNYSKQLKSSVGKMMLVR